jgi:hypothetical protein
VTPGYGPIEQYAGGGRQGPWTDIYAMGATLFWLVTGTKPSRRRRASAEGPAAERGEIAKGRFSDDSCARSTGRCSSIRRTGRRTSAVPRALFKAHAGALNLQDALRDSDEEVARRRPGSATSLAAACKGRLVRFGRALGARLMAHGREDDDRHGRDRARADDDHGVLQPRATVDEVRRTELQNLERLSQSTAGRIAQLVGDSRNLANYLGTTTTSSPISRSPRPTAPRRSSRSSTAW